MVNIESVKLYVSATMYINGYAINIVIIFHFANILYYLLDSVACTSIGTQLT